MEPQKNETKEVRLPLIIPDSRQLYLREDARLLSIRTGELPLTQVSQLLAERGLRSLKNLGHMEPINGVAGYALYQELGQPLPRVRGHIDPKWRLSLFSLDRLLEHEDRYDPIDIQFIHQALTMTRRHVGSPADHAKSVLKK